MFSVDESLLLIIDVQGKLAHMVDDHESTIKNIQALIQASEVLQIPLLLTEQAPDKIGETISEIKRKLLNINPIIKPSFSCCGVQEFNNELDSFGRKQIIVCGIEAHVCVYQTVSDLIKQGYQVQVVVDAISSRGKVKKDIAVERMQHMGAALTTAEMVITELLQTTEHPQFKDILRLMKA